MTIRFSLLSRLAARIVASRGCKFAQRTACVFALTSMLAATSHAQLIDGLVYTDQGDAIGSAALSQPVSSDNYQVDPGTAVGQGVYVGPGGPTSPMQVPSAMNPSMQTENRYSNQGWPTAGQVKATGGRTKYVNQAMPQGPFMQNEPIYSEPGYSIPCPCDAGCDFTYYGSAEALYFRRDYDERFTLSQATALPPFDYEWGGRVTVGQVWDCVNGYEAVYAGPFKWDRVSTVTGGGNAFQSRLVPVNLPVGSLSGFNNANTHNQVYRARMNSVEVNRRWWAWDVFSTLVGLRYVDYREQYGFSSAGMNGQGLYEDFTRNFMIGPQIGGDIMQPLGLRTLIGFKGKAALLANLSRNEVALQNNGAGILNAVDSDVDVAGLFEFGAYAKYSITPSIRLHAGYEFWYIPGVATVPSQNLNIVSSGTGIKVDADDDLLIHGGSFGAQILY